MELTFVWVGKTKNKHWAALEQDYLARIAHFARSQIEVVREMKGTELSGMRVKAQDQAAEAVLKRIRPDAYVAVLDERGAVLSSREFATLIAQRHNEGIKEMAFIIGGASGVPAAVRQRADFTLSLSPMTFPHEMARVVLLEQVYRAFAILHNLPYPR
jgi:23S rRNA (pseudouridine1915-N3)-methyltransferase